MILRLLQKIGGKAFAMKSSQDTSRVHALEPSCNAMTRRMSNLIPSLPAQVPRLGHGASPSASGSGQGFRFRGSMSLALLVLVLLAVGITPTAQAQTTVHVGGPSTAIGQALTSGDTIKVPLFFSNFTSSEMTQISFSIGYEAARLTFVEARSQVAEDFDLSVTNTTANNARTFTFSAKTAGLPYGAFPLTTLCFLPAGGSGNTSLNITGGTVTGNGNQTFANSTIALQAQASMRTDLNQDGLTDLVDVNPAFQYVLSGYMSQRKAGNASYDFSGRLPTGAHDVAILQRHILGLNPTLPNLTQDTITPTRTNARFTLSQPTSLGGGYFRYTIQGTQLAGLLSAEFTLPLANSQTLQSVSLAQSAYGEIRTKTGSINSTSYLFVYWVGLEPLIDANATLLQITVKQNSTATVSAFTGTPNAFLNEGAIHSNWPSVIAAPELSVTPVHNLAIPMRRALLRAQDGRLQFLPGEGAPAKHAVDAAGRRLILP